MMWAAFEASHRSGEAVRHGATHGRPRGCRSLWLGVALVVGCTDGVMGTARDASNDSSTRIDSGGPIADAGHSSMGVTDGGMANPAEATDAGGAPSFDAAPSRDGGSPSRSASCDGSELICTDFENGVGEGWSIAESRGGGAQITSDRAYEGMRSLHVRVPPTGGAKAMISTAAPFPVNGNAFFGRAYIYFDRPINDGHTHFLRAAGPDPASNGTAAYRLDGVGYDRTRPDQTSFNGRMESRASSDRRHGGARTGLVELELERWLCLEWEYDGANDVARYWIDGAEAAALGVVERADGIAWRAPTPFQNIEIGIRQYDAAGGTPSNAWLDGVALSSRRLGCAASE